MTTTSASPLHDVAILTRAVENVFRKLIRLLIGKMSLKKLQEMIQIIFIEEAEAKLKLEAPGKNVALGDIALQTGVDTRTIKRTLTHIAVRNPVYQDENFLCGFMPLFKVFDLWMTDDRFFDQKSAEPLELKVEGGGATFSELVRTAIQARGLSIQTVLKRLKDINVIEENKSAGTVTLKQKNNVFISKNELDMLDVGLTAIGSLVNTVSHNIENNQNGDAKYFQRGSWNYQFDPNKIDEVRKKIQTYLIKVDQNSRKLITSLAEKETQEGQLTAGISIFYFEENAKH